MKSKFLIIFFFVLVYAFSDTIYLKDGHVIKGKIIKEYKYQVIVLLPFGKINIPMKNIDKIIIDELNTEKNNELQNNRNLLDNKYSSDKKSDLDFLSYITYLNIGLGLSITGTTILGVGSIVFFTRFYLFYVGVISYEDFKPVMNNGNNGGLSSDFVINMSVPLISTALLTLSSIPFFIMSNYYKNKYKKKYSQSIISGYNGERVAIGLRLELDL